MPSTRAALFSTVAALIILIVGCEKKASSEIDYGTVTDSVYRNEYFRFSVAIPPGWSIQDQETRQQVVQAGTNALAGDDANLKAALKAAEQQTVHLLMAFEHPIGSPVEFNPGIMCIAERVRDLPGITRGRDYHFHMKNVINAGQMNVQFEEETSTRTLGGIEFDTLRTSMQVGPATARQTYYTTIMHGYALVLVASFKTAEQESMLDGVLRGVRFE